MNHQSQDLATPPTGGPQQGLDMAPFTAIFGGVLTGPDGEVSQADIIISEGQIAEIGSLMCYPTGTNLIDANGSMITHRLTGNSVIVGQTDELELVSLDPAGLSPSALVVCSKDVRTREFDEAR